MALDETEFLLLSINTERIKTYGNDIYFVQPVIR